MCSLNLLEEKEEESELKFIMQKISYILWVYSLLLSTDFCYKNTFTKHNF
jgi:hypothetical protein